MNAIKSWAKQRCNIEQHTKISERRKTAEASDSHSIQQSWVKPEKKVNVDRYICTLPDGAGH